MLTNDDLRTFMQELWDQLPELPAAQQQRFRRAWDELVMYLQKAPRTDRDLYQTLIRLITDEAPALIAFADELRGHLDPAGAELRGYEPSPDPIPAPGPPVWISNDIIGEAKRLGRSQ